MLWLVSKQLLRSLSEFHHCKGTIMSYSIVSGWKRTVVCIRFFFPKTEQMLAVNCVYSVPGYISGKDLYLEWLSPSLARVKYWCFLFQDPILRRSGMYTVAMAYCGSGNNKAIRRLLHVAVSTVILLTLWWESKPITLTRFVSVVLLFWTQSENAKWWKLSLLIWMEIAGSSDIRISRLSAREPHVTKTCENKTWF